MYIRLHVGIHYSCQILMELVFCRQISKNTRIPNFVKIRPEGAEFFHADRRRRRQTDVTKLIVIFLNFPNKLVKHHTIELNEEFPDSYMARINVT